MRPLRALVNMTESPMTLDALRFPLTGARLIEASAGTGKTYTLALLYLRLILGHGGASHGFHQALSPRDILVVTFTTAAAEELRERIRTRLVEAADYFYQRLPARASDDPIEQLRADYDPGDWNLCAWKLQVAAESMDEAQVSTTHSWCHQVLVEQAFDTRGLFNRQLVSDTDDLLAEVVRDYWRIHFQSLSEAEAELIDAAIGSPDALRERLRPLLSATSDGITFEGAPLTVSTLAPYLARNLAYAEAQAAAQQTYAEAMHHRNALESKAQQQWLNDWPTVERHLLELRTSLAPRSHKSASLEEYRALLDAIYAWAQGHEKAPTLLKNFAKGNFKFLKNGDFSQADDLPAFARLKQWIDTPKPLKPSVDRPDVDITAAVLAHARPWIEQALNARLRHRAEMSFDDLLVELNKALDPHADPAAAERLAAHLRERFPVALIDEFQDTDPIQYRIIDRIYALAENRPETGIFMIGDPKQAIYSFRGADIHTYLQAREATRGRVYTLPTNFRSTRAVVDACNSVFSHAEGHHRGAFRFKDGHHNPLPFYPVSAAGRPETLYLPTDTGDVAAANALTLWHFTPEDSSEPALTTANYREQAAKAAATQIARWLRAAANNQAGLGDGGTVKTRLRPADIALLVRTGTEAKALREALRKRNIASVYLSDRESLFASQEAQDVLHWLHACAHPLNERLVRAALGTNSLDIPLEQLAHWQSDELAWEAQMLHFRELHELWQRQGVLVMLNSLLQRFNLPSRLMQQSNGERQLTNLLHLAEWLQQASTQLDGEQTLIRHLSAQIESSDQEQLLRLESDANRVKVITIHKSKGLDYPLVMLPFISSWKDIDGKTRQVSVHQGRSKVIEIAGKKAFETAWAQANDERISEDMRLLYVALTRAQHSLWLGVAALKSGKASKPQVERSAMGYLLNAGEPMADAAAFAQCLSDLAGQSHAITLCAAPTPDDNPAPARAERSLESARTLRTRTLLPRWWIASYSAIQFQSDRDTPAPMADEVESDSQTAQQDQLDEESRITPPLAALGLTAASNAARETLSATNVLHHFPAGATWGTVLHSLLEWAAQQTFQSIGEKTDCYQRFVTFCQRRQIEPRLIDSLWQWLIDFIARPWPLGALSPNVGFALADLKPEQIVVEMEFMIESHALSTIQLDEAVCAHTPKFDQLERPRARTKQLNGMLKGFIDLVAEHDGRYYVIDWKSNRLGFSDADYTQAAMLEHMSSHRYDLQYALYLLALHRQLKARLPGYDYDQHVGGAIYVFLRGSHHHETNGLFCDKPPRALIETLDQLFAGVSQGQSA
jgi:exodeoxyribonuclease V beta subunit